MVVKNRLPKFRDLTAQYVLFAEHMELTSAGLQMNNEVLFMLGVVLELDEVGVVGVVGLSVVGVCAPVLIE